MGLDRQHFIPKRPQPSELCLDVYIGEVSPYDGCLDLCPPCRHMDGVGDDHVDIAVEACTGVPATALVLVL